VKIINNHSPVNVDFIGLVMWPKVKGFWRKGY